ncbi:glucose-6-phosphate isomerase family protein [Cryobacterium sp. PH31-O1]|uniref:glucose-6-phosphate isomerase family protein n=1 Tax=Cryobacterium sp. PH31-O1 TaxID=3046306 RepID=UPI0024BA10A6|nr:glucose-6-phosphate isomerase family protein [Cryobacterium sp. PH31-O1]MDJ0336689.1 glucose-6-phosphate isomerase family protein [Cryobacterium sp. PH31-O1]
MLHTQHPVDQPTLLEVFATGDLTGSSRRYEKHITDMAGVYLSEASWSQQVSTAAADTLVYSVNEQKYQDGSGALIIGTSTVLPGTYGDEYAVTRGHLHTTSDRAELYYCLSGKGVMLLDTVDGDSQAIELTAGKAVNVPGQWVHRSVNVGTEPFVTLFCYSADAGQNYGIISDAGGMKTLVVHDGDAGWTTIPNPRHIGYTRGQTS